MATSLSRFKAFACLIAAAFFWALPPVLGKHVAFSVPPAFTTVFRLVLSAALFLPFLMKRENLARLKHIDKHTALLLLVSGCVFFGPHYVLYFLSLQFTHATHASVLLQTGYIFSAIFCIAFLKESRSARKMAGIGLANGGIVIVLLEQVFTPGEAALPLWSVVLGGLLMIASQVSWAAYATLNKKYLATVGPVPSNFLNFMLGAVAVMPFAMEGFQQAPLYTLDTWFVLALIAVCGSFMGYLLYNEGLKSMEGSKASMILLVNPIFAVLLSMLFLGESISIAFVAGAGIIIVSLALVIMERKARCPVVPPVE